MPRMPTFTHNPTFQHPSFTSYSSPKYSTYQQPFYEYANDSSSTSNDERNFPLPHHGAHASPPFMPKQRMRTASFSAPRMAAAYKTDYPDQSYYTVYPNCKTPPRHHPVSTTEPLRRQRRFSTTPHGDGLQYGSNGSPPPKRRTSFRSPMQSTPLGDFEYADFGSTPFYTEIHPRYEMPMRQSQEQPRLRRTTSTKTRKTSANHKPSYYQEPLYYEEYVHEKVHVESTPRSSPKSRRTSHSQPESHHRRKSSSGTTPKPKEPSTPKPSTPKAHPKATAKDLERWHIPEGYSTKNWDPTETPILLVGSVFDANSLGKWIYDWTVLHFHAGTPISEMAGEFWLLLIRLAARIKRAKNGKERVRNDHEYELISEFLLSGRRLWKGLEDLVGECEHYMWKQVKKGGKRAEELKKDAGVEFVEAMFGRDRELPGTEILMQKIRTWTHRFDQNVDEVLKGKSRN